MKKTLTHKGFSYVDLTVLIVIISLMVGAVIKGQAMINDAKHKRLMNDLEGISAAYFKYYERYNALPGDDSDNHGWSGVTSGDGNERIGGDNRNDESESHEAWQALRYSDLLSGDPEATGNVHIPMNPYNGRYYFGNRDFGTGIGRKNYVRVDNISGGTAEMIDIKFDDGSYSKGTIQANQEYSNTTVELYYAL